MEEIRKLLPKLTSKELTALSDEVTLIIKTHEVNHLINKCLYEEHLLNGTELTEESSKQLESLRGMLKNELLSIPQRTRVNEITMTYLNTGVMDSDEMLNFSREMMSSLFTSDLVKDNPILAGIMGPLQDMLKELMNPETKEESDSEEVHPVN